MVEQFGVPYRPAERFFAELSPKLQNQLNQIEPTPDPDMIMYPCRVKMKNGDGHSCVYIADAQDYIDVLRIWPEDQPGDGPILVEDVVDIQESPYRMPTRFAKLLYDAGEASMGSWRYTANFRDGSERAYYNNDLVFDFIAAPAGMTNKDIISVEPHVTRATTRRERGRALEYRWCLHGHGKPSRDFRILRKKD